MRTLAATLALIFLASQDDDFAKLSRSKDPDDRVKAIDAIKKQRDLKMAQLLLPLLADAHPRVRYRAMRAIGDSKDPEVVDFLVKAGLKHGDKHVRLHSCEALGWIKDNRAFDALVAALQDNEALVRAQAADALAWCRAKDQKVVDALLAAFQKDKSWEGRAWALDAASRLEPTFVGEHLVMACSDKAYQVRLEAALAVAKHKIPAEAGLKVFKALIADADWRVRVQAMEAALVVRHADCVGPIVDLLAKEKGRLRLDAWLALQDLTGKELGLDPKAWQAWWEANKDSFTPPAPGASGPRPDGSVPTKAEFFSIPILSNRVAFVLDLSGSMRDEAPSQDPRKKETKLDVAQKGMVKTIGSFTQDVWFNILCLGCEDDGTYRREQKIWKKKLMPGNDANRKDATKFTNTAEARGWTNIWDGIEYAFEDEEIDTIFLYSDGGASRGVWTSTGDILAQLDRMNRFRKIMVYTVETPGAKANTADNIRLLKELAEKTKGRYKLADTK